MAEAVIMPAVIVAFIYNNLATDYVLRRVRQECPDDYAAILGAKKESWIEHQSLLFPLKDIPLVFKVYRYIVTRKNREIVSRSLWALFSSSLLLIAVAVLWALMRMVAYLV